MPTSACAQGRCQNGARTGRVRVLAVGGHGRTHWQSARSSRPGHRSGAPVCQWCPGLTLGEAPRDRGRERPPCSTLSRSVPARLTCRTLVYRTGHCFGHMPGHARGLSLPGKGLDLRKFKTGWGASCDLCDAELMPLVDRVDMASCNRYRDSDTPRTTALALPSKDLQIRRSIPPVRPVRRQAGIRIRTSASCPLSGIDAIVPYRPTSP